MRKFDPAPSAKFAAELLAEAKIPYALIGRVAVWSWVPTDQQAFTKDVDLAVRSSDMPRLRSLLARKRLRASPRRIGGLSIEKGDVRLDFIDRSADGFGPLFDEAIHVARRAGNVADVGGTSLPVSLPST